MKQAKIKRREHLLLFVDGDGWMMKTDSHATFDLFGTYILPLPFLHSMPASSVLSVIQELNPTAVITVRNAA